jgi:Flp pilus assembly pilin Flp
MVEYALLVALIAVVAIAAVQTLGTGISDRLQSAANAISN